MALERTHWWEFRLLQENDGIVDRKTVEDTKEIIRSRISKIPKR